LTQSEMMHKGIKGSILHIIDHAGHVSNLEQPIEFNKPLLHFLTSLSEVGTEKPNGNQDSLI